MKMGIIEYQHGMIIIDSLVNDSGISKSPEQSGRQSPETKTWNLLCGEIIKFPKKSSR